MDKLKLIKLYILVIIQNFNQLVDHILYPNVNKQVISNKDKLHDSILLEL